MQRFVWSKQRRAVERSHQVTRTTMATAEPMRLNHTRLDGRDCSNTEKDFRKYIVVDVLIGLNCKKCLSEWVLPSFLHDGDERESSLIVGETVFYLKKVTEYKEADLSYHKKEIRNLDNLSSYLGLGDHISYGIKYVPTKYHHAIVVGITERPGRDSICVIHWQKKGQGSGGCIVESDLDVSDKTCIFKLVYSSGTFGADEITLTIARAMAWVNERGYSFLERNCEHFAFFCKLGVHRCWQIEEFVSNALDLGKREMSSFIGQVLAVIADVVGGSIEVGNFPEHLASLKVQAIGSAFVFISQIVSYLIQVRRLDEELASGAIGQEEYMRRRGEIIADCLTTCFFVGVISPVVATILASLSAPAWLCTVIGIIVGGVLVAQCPGKYNIPIRCLLVSSGVRCITQFDHKDEQVHTMDELSVGDQIVRLGWCLHPRCHAIVVGLDRNDDRIEIIRFTYGKGVVREWVHVPKPLYKVLYDDEDVPFSPDQVVRRAKDMVRENNLTYDILQNNCKSFARWCKTGQKPTAVTNQIGYD